MQLKAFVDTCFHRRCCAAAAGATAAAAAAAAGTRQAITQPGTRLIELPRSCMLTYDESADPRVLALIQQVPEELWGAKLALQVSDGRVE